MDRGTSKKTSNGHVYRGVNGHAVSISLDPGSADKLNWNQFVVGDSRNLSTLFAAEPIVDVTVTSPPYWDAKDYGTDVQIGFGQSLDAYLDDLTEVFSAVWRCTKDSGSLWVVIKSLQKNRQSHLLPFMLVDRLSKRTPETWHLQDVLIWHKTHTLPWTHGNKLTDSFEYILCFSKSREFQINIDAVRCHSGITNWWVKYPERYHPHGKALSNVWEIPIPTQGSWGDGKFAHACPLPLELVKRIILLSTDAKGTVFDPFAGTGTTALAAKELRRKWFVIDANPNYREMFLKRQRDEPPTLAPAEKSPRRGLASTNLQLRQLKYAMLVYKRIAPSQRLTAANVRFLVLIAGTQQKQSNPHWVKNVTLYVVVDDVTHKSRAAEIRDEIGKQSRQPPLSKFQLDISVQIVSHANFRKTKPLKCKRLYHYSRGQFWSATNSIHVDAIEGIVPLNGLPPLLSNIRLQEQPAY